MIPAHILHAPFPSFVALPLLFPPGCRQGKGSLCCCLTGCGVSGSCLGGRPFRSGAPQDLRGPAVCDVQGGRADGGHMAQSGCMAGGTRSTALSEQHGTNVLNVHCLPHCLPAAAVYFSPYFCISQTMLGLFFLTR